MGSAAFALCWVAGTQAARTRSCLVLYPSFMVDQPVTLGKALASGFIIPAYITGGWCMLGIKGDNMSEGVLQIDTFVKMEPYGQVPDFTVSIELETQSHEAHSTQALFLLHLVWAFPSAFCSMSSFHIRTKLSSLQTW